MLPREIKFANPIKVLIVEDDESQARLMVKYLQETLACEIFVASDGIDALKFMLQDEQVPNVILLDLILPHLNGIEFLNILRGRPEFDHIPVIVCTSIDDSSNIKRVIDNRIEGYLVKPVKQEKLVEKLLYALHDLKARVDYQF